MRELYDEAHDIDDMRENREGEISGANKAALTQFEVAMNRANSYLAVPSIKKAALEAIEKEKKDGHPLRYAVPEPAKEEKAGSKNQDSAKTTDTKDGKVEGNIFAQIKNWKIVKALKKTVDNMVETFKKPNFVRALTAGGVLVGGYHILKHLGIGVYNHAAMAFGTNLATVGAVFGLKAVAITSVILIIKMWDIILNQKNKAKVEKDKDKAAQVKKETDGEKEKAAGTNTVLTGASPAIA